MKLRAKMRAMLRAFDIRAFLKEYDPDHRDYGNEVAVRCPDCEKPEKLWVLCNDKPNKKAGQWVCYYCDEGGSDVLALVRKLEDVSLFEALEIITSHSQGGGESGDLNALQRLVEETLFGVSELDTKWDGTFEPVPLPVEFKRARDVSKYPYFAERGITQERADKYKLGVCTKGRYANRLVVPVTIHGKHAFFVARYMKAKPPKDKRTGEPGKKTLYPVGARPNKVLFNYDIAKTYERVYLVEDVFSAMAIGNQAMATFGTAFSQYQLDLLLQTNAQEIVIMWDRDDNAKPGQSGYEKAQKLAERLSEFWTVRNVHLPDERDPDELPRKERRKLVKQTRTLSEFGAWSESVLTAASRARP